MAKAEKQTEPATHDEPAKPAELKTYRTRRRLAIPGVGAFAEGQVVALTAEQWQANRNSLVPVNREDTGKADKTR
jgi:hypothetical protein